MAAQVETYRRVHHSLPRTLADIFPVDGNSYPHWLTYIVRGSKYTIVSYGRDGKPGGEWVDADQSSGDPPGRRAPSLLFWHFLFDVMPDLQTETVALTGFITLFVSSFMLRNATMKRNDIVAGAIPLLLVVAATTLVGAVLTAMHTIQLIHEH